jgi:hypothetical protein
MRVKDAGGSECHPVVGWIGVEDGQHYPTRKRADFPCGSCITREIGQPTKETKQMTAVATPVMRKNCRSCDQAARGHDTDRFKMSSADLMPRASRLERFRRLRVGLKERTSTLVAAPGSTTPTGSACPDGRFSGGLLSTRFVCLAPFRETTPGMPETSSRRKIASLVWGFIGLDARQSR